MKQAVIYVRASLDRTGEGASVSRQEEACRALALARGWEVVAVKSDNSVSASTGKERPAWEAVLALIERGEVDVVIAWHMDRITRTMLDLERLILLAVDHGVGIATATGDIDLSTDGGRMVARILAAVARAEVERKAQRQILAYRQKAMEGRPNWGTRPFGFEKDGTLRKVEADALAEVYRDVLNGSTLAACAQRLNEAGLPTTHGTPWGGHVMRPVLLNPRNIAKATYRGEIVADMDCEPIVTEDTFYAVKHLLTDPSRNNGGGGTVQTLLTGIAECGRCGGKVKMNWKGRKRTQEDKNNYRRYGCPQGHVTMPMDFVDGVVFLRLVGQDAQAWAQTVLPEVDPEKAKALGDESTALTVRLDEAAAAFADGTLTMAQLATMNERMRSRIETIETELATLGGATESYSFAANFEYIAQEFDQMPLDRQRSIIKVVYDRIVLVPSGRGVTATEDHIVSVRRGEEDTDIPSEVARPDRYLPLAQVLVAAQPQGVRTLREAASWLHNEGHTQLKPSGVQSRLSTYTTYDQRTGWMMKDALR